MGELADAVVARLIHLAPLLVLALVAEQFALADARGPFRSVPFNAAYTAVVTAGQVLMFAAVSGYLAATSTSALRILNLKVSDPTAWWQPWAAGFAWLMLRDFFYYWFHRLQHGTKWLWWEHELHHTDPNMNVTTSGRHHWLELPLLLVFQVIPFGLLVGFDPIVAVAGSIFGELLGLFTHMNVRARFGRFSWVVTNPQVHRIHHSVEPQHRNKNFAAYCPLWDVVFGTYYAPSRDEFPVTGLRSGYVPTWWQAFAVKLPIGRG